MAESKKMFSRLDEMFARIRRQDPVMNLHEVEALIEKQIPVVAKKSIGLWRILGIVALIGLANLGIIWLWNAESGNKKITNPPVVTENSSQANSVSPEKKNNIETISPIAEPVKNSVRQLTDVNPAINNSDNSTNIKSGSDKTVTNRVTVRSANINFSFHNHQIRMMVASNNDVEELIIDDENISPENFIQHKAVIAEGLKIKKENQKDISITGALSEKDRSDSKADRQLMNAMVKQLSVDELVIDNQPFDFRLTGTELFLNGQIQDAAIFDQYKNHFLNITGESLPENYNLHIKR